MSYDYTFRTCAYLSCNTNIDTCSYKEFGEELSDANIPITDRADKCEPSGVFNSTEGKIQLFSYNYLCPGDVGAYSCCSFLEGHVIFAGQ